MFQGSLKEIQVISGKFQMGFKGVLRKFQGCFKDVSRMFQEYFKEVSGGF